MERPDPLRELFPRQMTRMKKNEVNFKRQDTGYAQKDEHHSKHI